MKNNKYGYKLYKQKQNEKYKLFNYCYSYDFALKIIEMYKRRKIIMGSTGTNSRLSQLKQLEDRADKLERELMEETGATEFDIKPICVYSVKGKNRVNENADDESFGMLFIADVFLFEELHSEIEKILITDTLVEEWTYPLIQPKLIEEAKNRGFV